ncbi:MAG: hypothetical protein KDA92_08095 [Planctomycetales bacterium]|nr:hypothetical protein [Planctomycetales bacterium]MCA9166176.1 hypothetical protein [Planctomycetales bacterium]
MVQHLGKRHKVADLTPTAFQNLRAKLAKNFGPTTLGNDITRVHTVLKWASDQQLVEKPVVFGQGFERPSKKTQRLHRAAKAKEGRPTDPSGGRNGFERPVN